MTNAVALSPYSYNTNGIPGKFSVPVNPSSVIYAQFNNISGYAANPGQQGVPITKIRIINSLINDLNKLKNEKASEIVDKNMPDSAKDAMIDKLQAELTNIMNKQPEASFMLSGAQPMPGEIVNMVA